MSLERSGVIEVSPKVELLLGPDSRSEETSRVQHCSYALTPFNYHALRR